MNRCSNRIITSIFIVFLWGIFVLNLLTPDRKFSESENRFLQTMPKIKIKYIMDGRFMDKFSDYISDQFVFKDFFVGFKSDVERYMLKGENNGVFFGKDGYLLEDYKKPKDALDDNIKDINYFIDAMPDVSTYFMLVPNSVKVYEDKLPIFAAPYDQLKSIDYVKNNIDSNIKFIDVYKSLKDKKDEYIYFRTDHHWTMRGAYYAYKYCGDYLNYNPYNLDDFNSKVVSEDFYGSYYRKANKKNVQSDSIEMFENKFSTDYNMYIYDNDSNTQSLFMPKNLKKVDKYSYFLDGNHSLVTIKTNVQNKRKLVVFKDSYAHCFIPFLANHYEEIHILDLRYYKSDVYDYIKKNNINEALFLYNTAAFSEDENILWMGKMGK